MIEAISKYNFWGNKEIPLGYERTEYLTSISRYVGNSLVKVLVGQRRAGKSFLLRQIAHQMIAGGKVEARNTLFINLEFMELAEVRDAKALESLYQEFRQTIAGEGRVFLFIDEIQNVEGWELFVNSHSQDFAESCELFITGSNSRILSGELATMLSGRYVQFEVWPYSFTEFCAVNSLEMGHDAYWRYLHEGALPELQNLSEEDMRRSYMMSIRDTVMLRDIVVRYKVKDVQLLSDIFAFLVNNASSMISITNIVNYFTSHKRKTNYETLATYVGYLESAFLVHKVLRYNIRGKETLSGTAKYYLNDLAFHNYLYRGFGYGDGYLLENAVYTQLRRRGFCVYVGQAAGQEVDFVAIKGDERIYVQAALQLDSLTTIEREYASLRAIADNYRKVVVSMDRYRQPSNEGIENLWPWEL